MANFKATSHPIVSSINQRIYTGTAHLQELKDRDHYISYIKYQ